MIITTRFIGYGQAEIQFLVGKLCEFTLTTPEIVFGEQMLQTSYSEARLTLHASSPELVVPLNIEPTTGDVTLDVQFTVTGPKFTWEHPGYPTVEIATTGTVRVTYAADGTRQLFEAQAAYEATRITDTEI